jgi:hypothetical protein
LSLGRRRRCGACEAAQASWSRGALVAGLAVSAAARGRADLGDALRRRARRRRVRGRRGNGNTFKLKSGAAVSASVDWLLDDGRVGRSSIPSSAARCPARHSVSPPT